MDDFDAAVRASVGGPPQDPAQTARFGMQQAVGTNPDLYSELRRVAQVTGVPISTVQSDPDAAKRQAQLGTIDFSDLAHTSPSTAALLSDVDTAKLSHDDIGNLSAVERAIRSFGSAAVDVGKYAVSAPGAPGGGVTGDISRFSSTYLGASTIAGLQDMAGVGGKLLDKVNPFTTSAEEAAVLYRNDPAGLARFNASAAGFLPRFTQAMGEGSAQTMEGISPEAKADYGSLKYATTNPSEAAYLSPVKVLGDALRSVPTSVAMGLSIYLTRGAAAKAEADALAAGLSPAVARTAGIEAASATMAKLGASTEGVVGYAQQANQTVGDLQKLSDEKMAASPEYQKLLAEGYAPDAARQAVTQRTAEQSGLLAGIVDAAVNHVGGAFLGRIIGEGGKILPRIGKAGLTESLTEFFQSGGEQFGQNLATQKNVDPGQSLTEGVLENAIAGLAVGGVSGGFFGGLGGLGRNQVKAEAAQQTTELLTRIMQMADASKVRERDPDTFQAFLQQATQDGPLEKVYINPAEMQANGLDLTALEHLMPSAMPEMAQAVATGADIAIPTSELATRLPGSELEQSVLQHLKTEPDGFSQVGAQQYMQTHGESVRAEVEKVLAEHQADDAFKQSMQSVQDNVLAQLTAANRFTDDVNAPYAALWGAFFGVQAARLGVSPQALFDRFGPRIVAESTGGGFDQAGHPTTPEFRKWFAASTVVNDNGKPLVVYHGTNADFDTFSSDHAGKATQAANAGLGFFFVSRPDVADKYASRNGSEGANVMPVYLALTNPIRISAPNMMEADKLLTKQLGQMNDGAIIEVGAPGSQQTVYMVRGQSQIKSATGNNGNFDASKLSILEQAARGSFNPETNVVALLKAADLSTFLHESGHFFLEVTADLASQPDAPQQIKDDFDTFLKWTGVADAATWNAMSLDEQRPHHEDFARGFEAYLFEGKAPSIELQGVFQRFRAWLLNVYRSISGLHIKLTPEIRGVFDRMLATTEQIRTAEDVRGYEAMFLTKPAGMTDEEWSVYQTQANDATQQAITLLEARSLRDMKWLSGAKGRELKKLQKEAKARRDEVHADVTAEVDAMPVYQAIAAIKEQRKSDPSDRSAVKEWGAKRDAEQERLAGEVKAETLATPEAKGLKGLQKGQFLAKAKRQMANEIEARLLAWEKVTPKPTLNVSEPDLEALAALHGFTSGDELRRAIMEAPPAKEVIAGMTDRRMLEQHGDLTSPEAMERAAEEAIHNEARLKFAATEANALRKATGEPALLAAAVRQFAADIIARTKVRDLNPSIYTAAEKRAATAANKAADAGKLQDAAVQKRNQLINGYAAKAALDARAEVDKTVAYLKRFNKDSVYKSLDADYVDQIHALLERFDLRDSSLKAIDKRASLAAWLQAQQEAGLEPEIDADLVNESQRTSYKNLPMEQLRGLRDAVKQIEHLGRLKHKLLTAKDKRDYEQIRDGIVASITEHAGGKMADNRTRPTTLNAAIRLFNGYLLEHRKVASLVKELDGFKDGGPMWDAFTRTMNEAGDKEATMRADAAKKLAALVKPMREQGTFGKSLFIEGAATSEDRAKGKTGSSFTREERIGIALNMGNQGNIQRLLDGEGWNLGQVKRILDTLTSTDWRFVQNVWDFLESYRPEIGAKEKRVYGKEPDWVQPQSLTVMSADGKTVTLAGGYYPVKYDPSRSLQAQEHADADVAKQQMKGAFTSSTTRRSFTKSRVEEVKGRPLLYSMDGLFNGVNEIIHDLAFHEWLIDANKLLRSRSIGNAILTHYGAQVMSQFKSGVKDIAAGEFPATHAFERGLASLRGGTVIAGLAMNIMNSVINVQGLTQSMVRVGTKWTAVGIGRLAANPMALARDVAAKSEMMANRAMTLNREVNEIQSLVRDKSKLRQATDRFMFLPLTVTQQVVDLPTWWGAYQKALDGGEEEARAVSMADQAVLDSQSGGQVKDLAKIQRGGQFLKLWTTFYGFFSSTYNLSVERTKATDFTSPEQVVKLATDYALLLIVPALLGTVLKNAMTGGEWDEDKLAKKAIGDQISYMMGMLVGVRDVAGAVQLASGTSEFNQGYAGPAGVRFFGELYKLAMQAHQGEVDGPFLKSLNNVFGILLHYPSGQINRTVEGSVALADGTTTNPLAVIAGPPPKK